MFHWNRKNTEPHLTEKNNQGVTWLSFPSIEATGIVKHAFSTRMGGVSEGPFATMNFSFTRGDDPEAVKENYRRMADALQVDRNRMVLTWQTHTTNVRVVTEDDFGKGVVRDRDYLPRFSVSRKGHSNGIPRLGEHRSYHRCRGDRSSESRRCCRRRLMRGYHIVYHFRGIYNEDPCRSITCHSS